jgi:hypothetical protein
MRHCQCNSIAARFADCAFIAPEEAGIYASNAPVAAKDCVFQGAKDAAVAAYLGSRIRLEACTFQDNAADIYPSSSSDRIFASAPDTLSPADESVGAAMSLAAGSGVSFLGGSSTPSFADLREVRLPCFCHAQCNELSAAVATFCQLAQASQALARSPLHQQEHGIPGIMSRTLFVVVKT